MLTSNRSLCNNQELEELRARHADQDEMETTVGKLRESNVLELQQVNTRCSVISGGNSDSTLGDYQSNYSLDTNPIDAYFVVESTDDKGGEGGGGGEGGRRCRMNGAKRRSSRSQSNVVPRSLGRGREVAASIMRSRPIVKCKQFICMRKKAVIVATVGLFIVTTRLVLLFIYIIPSDNHLWRGRTKSDADSSSGSGEGDEGEYS